MGLPFVLPKEGDNTKAFYGSRFSPNMTRTPEGYLICHNVPIARTGWQDYLGREIDQPDKEWVKVYRDPEEVFSSATVASFEGKAATDDHPKQDVTPDNYNTYLRGIVTNVRRGSGDESDFLIADLIIYDPILQSEIEAGKREVSCGYLCNYEEIGEGQYKQTNIVGNHVAVVQSGRAGPEVSIKDSKPEPERRKKMAKVTQKFLASLGWKHYVQDAEPEEIEKAIDALGEGGGSTNPDAEADGTTKILAAIAQLTERVAALEKSDEEVHKGIPKDALDALEEELDPEKKAEDSDIGEESKTVPAEEMQDADVEPQPPKTTDSNALLKNVVRQMKPIIAGMKDPDEKKRATDALIASVKAQMVPAKTTNDYATIMEIAKNRAHDAAVKAQKDPRDFGKACAERNPHTRKEGK